MAVSVLALGMALSTSMQDASAAELRKQADAARATYEALQAKALQAEIAESEKAVAAQQAALSAQRARLAALRAPVPALPAATILPAPPAVPVPSALVEAAESSGATVTTETSMTKDGTTVSQKTTVTPYSQEDIRDGENKRKFGGIEFGVGIAYTLDTGKYQRIREAELVNNIVRVNRSENSSARFVLESHYLFTPVNSRLNGNTSDFLGLHNRCEKWSEPTPQAAADEADKGATVYPPKRTCETVRAQWGIGPFVALQPGTDNVIDAIGTGIMVGLRRSSKSTDSFNLGIGAMVDINAQTLGNGIVEDQPLPAGDTLRFKRRSQLGLLLMSSYSF
ncbi:hypothetical protein JW805_17390 [Roseomonas aeriglobus]|nr:hypothetical protein [Roseomonas aeriglobus]